MKQIGAGLVLALLALSGLSLGRTAPPSQPPVPGRGPVWANGHEVHGEPRFTVRDSVLYYQGTYRYYPLHEATKPGPPSSDSIARCSVMAEAQAAADDSAQTPLEWARRYVEVLRAHPEVVDSCSGSDHLIEIKFISTPVLHAVEVPQSFPIELPDPSTFGTRDNVIQSKMNEFYDAYNAGAWILFGGEPGHTYYTFIPRGLQPQFIAVLDAIQESAAGGLEGDALRQAARQSDVGDILLRHQDFLRDLLKACEARR
jgi:hypothetical protein